jgi:hypothetical protein
MRRDYFTLAVDGVAGEEPTRPVVTITYEGPTEQIETRLQKGSSMLEDGDVDVAYRLREPLESADAGGVVAIADRVTGEYVFELNAGAADVLAFVDAAREFGDRTDSESRYRIVLETEDEHLVTYDKSTLLVYDPDGNLLRGKSLIPSGVEI